MSDPLCCSCQYVAMIWHFGVPWPLSRHHTSWTYICHWCSYSIYWSNLLAICGPVSSHLLNHIIPYRANVYFISVVWLILMRISLHWRGGCFHIKVYIHKNTKSSWFGGIGMAICWIPLMVTIQTLTMQIYSFLQNFRCEIIWRKYTNLVYQVCVYRYMYCKPRFVHHANCCKSFHSNCYAC